MAFWLHEHRLIQAFRFLSLRLKIASIGLLWAMVIAGWAWLLFLPAQQSLHKERAIHRDLLEQKTAFEKVVNKLDALSAECKNLEKQSSSFDITPATFHESIDFLVHSLRKHGIACKHIQPQQRQKNDLFEKEYCTITMVGTFKQILTFLDEVKQSKRLIIFKTLDLVRWKNNAVKVTASIRIASLSQGAS